MTNSHLIGEPSKGMLELADEALPGTSAPLTSADIPLLQEGDILLHKTGGRFVFSGRTKLNEGPAYLEVYEIGPIAPIWRTIAFTAFRFVARPTLRQAASKARGEAQ